MHSLTKKRIQEMSWVGCQETLFSFKMLWVRRYHRPPPPQTQEIHIGHILLHFHIPTSCFNAGREIHTAGVDISWRLCYCIHQGVASYACLAILYSSTCNNWWSYSYHSIQNGSQWTKCLRESSNSSGADYWLN